MTTTYQDNTREWMQRRYMTQGQYHPPLYLELAAAGAREAMVYVPNPPESVDEAEERLRRGT